VPSAQVHIVDGGHFSLDTAANEIAARAGSSPGELGGGERKESDDDLCHPWPRRSFLWQQHSSGALPGARFVARPEVIKVMRQQASPESPDQQKRQEWIAALDKMESLKPRAIIAGHERVGNDDSPRIIGETRKYIRDFERLAMQTTTARELYEEMLKLYPDWINRGALWSSVHAIRNS